MTSDWDTIPQQVRERVVYALPERQLDAFCLYVESRSYNEIARVMGVSPPRARKLVEYAQRNLRRCGIEYDGWWMIHADVNGRCAHCDWTYEGPIDETRAAFTTHRESEHPFVQDTLPNPRSRMVTTAMRQAA